MGGYSRYAVVKEEPCNGAIAYVDLMLGFTDASGPTRIQEAHDPLIRNRVDVNDNLRPLIKGYRYRVDMTFEIFSMNDQQVLASLVDRWVDDDWIMSLSVDGGTTYTEMVLRDFDGPRAIANKTIVGARYRLRLQSTELLTEIPYITAAADPGLSAPIVGAVYILPADPAPGQTVRYVQAGVPDQLLAWLDDGSGSFSWTAFATG